MIPKIDENMIIRAHDDLLGQYASGQESNQAGRAELLKAYLYAEDYEACMAHLMAFNAAQLEAEKRGAK